MIYAFIRSFIGGFGRALMDFYIANSFLINALVLVYALFVYLAHISYLSAYRFILKKLGFDVEKFTKTKKDALLNGTLDLNKLNWDEVRRTFWFPFISPPRAVWIKFKTNPALQRMFREEKIKQILKG